MDAPLLDAVRTGDIERVAELLDGLDVKSELAQLALTEAVHSGIMTIISLLLERGVALANPTSTGATAALSRACRAGNRQLVEQLLQAQVPLDVVGGAKQRTPLMIALEAGACDVATVLIDAGARLDVRDSDGETVLHLALKAGYPRMASLLAAPGVHALLDVKANNGYTALHRGAAYDRREQLEALLQAGACIDAEDHEGATPLDFAVYWCSVEAIHVLLQYQASPEGGDPVEHPHRRPLRVLIDACADIDRDIDHHDAAQGVKLLLQHGADRWAIAADGQTARDVAATHKLDTIVQLLDSYFPFTPHVVAVLVGLRRAPETPLGRFARHGLFDRQVMSIVIAFVVGKESGAFTKLQEEVAGAAVV